MPSQWFVIHTLSGQEQKVKESIEKRLKTEEMGEYVHEVLVPMEKVAEVRSGKKTISTRKLHPGYVYINMTLLDDGRRILEKPWYFVRDTPGIIGFVGGERPMPVTPEEIAERRSAGFAPKVRIGVHASGATQVGQNFSGKGVHEAARIAALADGDQILSSSHTAAGGRFPASELRTVTLRGTSEPMEIVTIDWS
jgi:transcription antitermination factor NusG